jgi:ubiquinone/menaquinone biosynthesis C-methylase UbiE
MEMDLSSDTTGGAVGSGDLSFKWFAEHGFYRAVNTFLVDASGVGPGNRVVELACGTGAVTKLLLERLRGARDSLIIGIDASAASLREAVEELGSAKDVAIQFIQGRVEALSEMVKEHVDGVVFCNGIHYVEDKEGLLNQIWTTLKPGGTFAFNTSFFDGAHPPETEQFYRRWMMRAIRIVKARYNVMPKSDKTRVQSRVQLTPEQYTELLHGRGFSILKSEIRKMSVSLEGWVDISRYEDFVAGAMPGVPLDQGSEALQEGVKQTFADMGLQSVPRNWLCVVAQKA